jgi:hypothetical protein
MENQMIGKYVVVRCRDAGVHAGELVSFEGRQATLKNARRLWYWKPADGKAFLSAVAVFGLHKDSKVGVTQPLILLTEDCEIALCTEVASASIAAHPEYLPNA